MIVFSLRVFPHEIVFSFSISKQEEKTVVRIIDNRSQCSSTKLKSSLFQLIGKLAEIDAENVILSLQTNGLLETITRYRHKCSSMV